MTTVDLKTSITDTAGTSKQEVRHFLAGDVFQLASEERELLARGIPVGRMDIYPGLYTLEDYKKALELIWIHKWGGWELYRSAFFEHSICTEEGFNIARQTSVASQVESLSRSPLK